MFSCINGSNAPVTPQLKATITLFAANISFILGIFGKIFTLYKIPARNGVAMTITAFIPRNAEKKIAVDIAMVDISKSCLLIFSGSPWFVLSSDLSVIRFKVYTENVTMNADCNSNGFGGIPYKSDVRAYSNIPLRDKIIRDDAKKCRKRVKLLFS